MTFLVAVLLMANGFSFEMVVPVGTPEACEHAASNLMAKSPIPLVLADYACMSEDDFAKHRGDRPA